MHTQMNLEHARVERILNSTAFKVRGFRKEKNLRLPFCTGRRKRPRVYGMCVHYPSVYDRDPEWVDVKRESFILLIPLFMQLNYSFGQQNSFMLSTPSAEYSSTSSHLYFQFDTTLHIQSSLQPSFSLSLL